MRPSSARSVNTSPDPADHVESRMLGQRARPVRRAGMGKPTPERVHGVPSPTQHIPFESEAANLFFQLISNRYERASVIVTSNKP
ncbi:ATP-binding protein, partial [Kitasatospora sp. NPDC004240]